MPKHDKPSKPGKPDVHLIVAPALVIDPGDRVLITLKGKTSQEDADDIEARLQDAFPDATFVVVRGVDQVAVESNLTPPSPFDPSPGPTGNPPPPGPMG